MKLLLRLYPRWWRQRYGVEALELLEGRPVTLACLCDLIVGGVDAWLGQEMPPGIESGSDKPAANVEPFDYKRYYLPPLLLGPWGANGLQRPWERPRTWERISPGWLWVPALFGILVFSEWLVERGAQTVVLLTALAVVIGVLLVIGLVVLSGNHLRWGRALLSLWLPGTFALMMIATLLHVSGLVTFAAIIALLAAVSLIGQPAKRA